MSPIERTIDSFQELVAQVPEIVQPIIVMLAAAIPFVEGEGGAVTSPVGDNASRLAAIKISEGFNLGYCRAKPNNEVHARRFQPFGNHFLVVHTANHAPHARHCAGALRRHCLRHGRDSGRG